MNATLNHSTTLTNPFAGTIASRLLSQESSVQTDYPSHLQFSLLARRGTPGTDSPGLSETQGEFESLLSKVLQSLTNCLAERIDLELENSIHRICEFLEIEHSALWDCSGTNGADARFRCGYPAPKTHLQQDSLAASLRRKLALKCHAYFPWMSTQVQSGRTLLCSDVCELPIAARRDKRMLTRLGIRSCIVVPFSWKSRVLGMASYILNRENAPRSEVLAERLKLASQVLGIGALRAAQDGRWMEMLREIAANNGIFHEQALFGGESHEATQPVKRRAEPEATYVQIETPGHTEGRIIGRSAGILHVLHQVEQVAPAECSVLLSGETGTGKELIAEEIHRLSRRGDRLMVMLNCAALPSALVESELFGRERGAYTGALTAQAGLFQAANASTIFLDEIGELSMEVQPKLLRVLQKGEFQRLGNPKAHKVDVRVIAATNRDLAEEVRKGRFREDLYYRLKVFPIELPPLRERVEDIPRLVFAFVGEFSTKLGKRITKIPKETMNKLQRHSWPGNIRELRNVIEHSVILTSGDTLKIPVLMDHQVLQAEATTLADVEREHIVKTLEKTGWRIRGVKGAAQRLGLKPSTLYSRMEKLQIPSRRQKDETTANPLPPI